MYSVEMILKSSANAKVSYKSARSSFVKEEIDEFIKEATKNAIIIKINRFETPIEEDED